MRFQHSFGNLIHISSLLHIGHSLIHWHAKVQTCQAPVKILLKVCSFNIYKSRSAKKVAQRLPFHLWCLHDRKEKKFLSIKLATLFCSATCPYAHVGHSTWGWNTMIVLSRFVLQDERGTTCMQEKKTWSPSVYEGHIRFSRKKWIFAAILVHVRIFWRKEQATVHVSILCGCGFHSIPVSRSPSPLQMNWARRGCGSWTSCWLFWRSFYSPAWPFDVFPLWLRSSVVRACVY